MVDLDPQTLAQWKMKVTALVTHSCPTLWTVTHQVPLSIGFSRQEYGSGYHALLQGIFQTQGSNPWLLRWQVNSLALSHQGSPWGGSRGGEKYLKDKGDSIY